MLYPPLSRACSARTVIIPSSQQAPARQRAADVFGMTLTNEDAHWLAGLLEGEGSFLHGPPSKPNTPRIRVEMTDRDVIQRAARLMEVRSIHRGHRHPELGWKPSYSIMLKGVRSVRMMLALRPLMGELRREQIDRALRDYVLKRAGMSTSTVCQAGGVRTPTPRPQPLSYALPALRQNEWRKACAPHRGGPRSEGRLGVDPFCEARLPRGSSGRRGDVFSGSALSPNVVPSPDRDVRTRRRRKSADAHGRHAASRNTLRAPSQMATRIQDADRRSSR